MELNDRTQQQIREQAINAKDEYGVLDWSGSTALWRRHLSWTPRGVAAFRQAVLRSFPDALSITTEYKRGRGPHRLRLVSAELANEFELGSPSLGSDVGRVAHVGIGGDARRISDLLGQGYVTESQIATAFAHIVCVRRFVVKRRDLSEDVSSTVGRAIRIARLEDGLVDTSIRPRHPQDSAFIEKLQQTIATSFFTATDDLDLFSRQVVRQTSHENWYSRDIIQWCEQAPDHYVSVYKKAADRPDKLVGVRPAELLDGLR